MAGRADARSRSAALVAAAALAGAAGLAYALLLQRRRARAARGPARVAELRIFPLKSAGGCVVEQAEVTRFGFRYDRSFAVVDSESGEIQTQRKVPKMATIRTRIAGDRLIMWVPGKPELAVPLEPTGLEACSARKIGSVVVDLACWRFGAEVSTWLSDALGRPSLHLVRLDPERSMPAENGSAGAGGARPRLVREQLAGEAAGASDACAFHDWGAFLIASFESLADLNRRLGTKAVGIDRFRANIVVAGGDLRPYEEDRWTVVRAGEARFRCLESCVRCTVPSIDQETGERPDGQNPTAFMRNYRMQTERSCGPYASFGPVFGAWAAPDIAGEGGQAGGGVVLCVGDLLTVEGTASVSSYDHWARKHPEARPGR